MRHFLIDLAVPGALDRVFTYSVPPDLRPLARIGARALAPFGRKTVAGIMVGFPGERDAAAIDRSGGVAGTGGTVGVRGIRDILDVIDDRPVLDDGLMKLASWISEYYHAPVGEVLRAMLGSGLTGVAKTRVAAAGEITPQVLASLSRSPLQRAILEHLGRDGRAAVSTLRKTLGNPSLYPAIHELRRKGLLMLEEESPFRRPAMKTEPVVRVDSGALASWRRWLALNAPNKRAAKQTAVIRALAALPQGETAVAAFLRGHGLSPSAFDALVRKGAIGVTRREVIRGGADEGDTGDGGPIRLNDHQRAALAAVLESVESGSFAAYLLWGITGSGKTQVYIEAIARALELGKTALVLVPEISLTPQTVGRFRRRFGARVAMFHSRMSRGERDDAWRLAREGRCSIVIGPRSAVFAPLSNLGLIVVDEEHEPSYKQYDQSPRYHARDAAVVRAKLTGAAVVLGSATPSVESFWNARSGKYRLLELPERADGARLPSVTIVDMAGERKMKFEAWRASRKAEFKADPIGASLPTRTFEPGSLSDLLRDRIADRLSKKEGVLILQNRRGFSAYLECRECGRIEMCERCRISLTFHRSGRLLRCHYCGFTKSPPLFCGECGAGDLRYFGAGTQRVEDELRAAFPGAAIERMDLDTTARKGSHASILDRFARGAIDILVGTQMIAKGLDIARVTLVGVVSADIQLLLPDFRSAERTFQLLTQVAGRSGRRKIPGEVVVQTVQPTHPTMRDVARHDYVGFFDDELRYRKELGYPPFTRLALLEFTGEVEADVRRAAEEAARALKKQNAPGIVMGPSPAAIEKVRNRYRWHIVVKTPRANDPSGSLLARRLHALPPARRSGVRLTIDADPQSLM